MKMFIQYPNEILLMKILLPTTDSYSKDFESKSFMEDEKEVKKKHMKKTLSPMKSVDIHMFAILTPLFTFNHFDLNIILLVFISG